MPALQSIRPSAWPGVATPLAVLALLAAPIFTSSARAADPGWPRQFNSASGSFVIYEPQPEDLEGDVLTGRAAFSLQKTGDDNPVFGVLWFTARIQIDRDSSTVTELDLDVTKVRLPQITPDEASRYEKLVEREAARWDLSGSLEELQAGLAAAEKERASVDGLKNDPPRIRFSDRRAILIVYDGVPALEPIEGSNLEYVANTPYAVLYDPVARTYFLNGANLWYSAQNPLGPWTHIGEPPAAVREVMPPDTSSADQVQGTPPLVLTATAPTELISTDGPPEYAPLVGDELLYVTNTESDVLRDVSTQDLYVLLAGRWYSAPSPSGPWTYVRGDELPAVFKQIPADSPKGHLLASVAGTDQADDAVADAEIPQTSAVRRDGHDFAVSYDGPAQFEPIPGTDLQYAVNTDAEVIYADGRYYACDQGVWYIADDPNGPWSVSETRPLGLEDVPPSCPVYDVRYVYIFSYTPEVVYVGYLPGYLGCFPYYGTVVYGTGHHYPPWRGRRHYYPRPHTWGFQARYNPWLSRWSFGYSYGTGFLRVGSRWHPGREPARRSGRALWFGPGGFRRPLVAQDMTLLRTWRRGTSRPRLADRLPANLYSRTENVTRVDRAAIRMPVRPLAQPAARPALLPNNVFAGKDGKVYRRDDTGKWKVNEGRAWKPTPVPVVAPGTHSSTGGGNKNNSATKRASPNLRPFPRPAPVETPAEPSPPSGDRPPARPAPTPAPAQPPAERAAEQRERPSVHPAPAERAPEQREKPSVRPAPAPVSPTPGDLEREYRARERAGRESPPRVTPQPARERPEPERQERQKEGAPRERKR